MDQRLTKGIILAGGNGSRLFPATQVMGKQLLPVYDKPLIYYPLSTQMMMGVRDILIISTPRDLPLFEHLLGDGSRLGLQFHYQEQPRPEGIAQAFVLGEKFIGRDPVALILGDNIFYGKFNLLREAQSFEQGGMIFGYAVRNPERYGVVKFDKDHRVVSIEEKPRRPKSNCVVTGLYVYDSEVVRIARSLKPSSRGELEITDVNNVYVSQGKLRLVELGRGIAWLDTGTHETMLEASNFIATIERRQGLKIACPEEIALRMGYISRSQAERLVAEMVDSSYRDYVAAVVKEASLGTS